MKNYQSPHRYVSDDNIERYWYKNFYIKIGAPSFIWKYALVQTCQTEYTKRMFARLADELEPITETQFRNALCRALDIINDNIELLD